MGCAGRAGVGGASLAPSLAASRAVSWRSGWRHLLRLPVAFGCLHIAYGLGFLSGLVRRLLRQPVAIPREAKAP